MNELFAIQCRAKGSEYESSWELFCAHGSRDSADWNLNKSKDALSDKEFRIVRYVHAPMIDQASNLSTMLRDPFLWEHDNVLLRSAAADEIEGLRGALDDIRKMCSSAAPHLSAANIRLRLIYDHTDVVLNDGSSGETGLKP